MARDEISSHRVRRTRARVRDVAIFAWVLNFFLCFLPLFFPLSSEHINLYFPFLVDSTRVRAYASLSVVIVTLVCCSTDWMKRSSISENCETVLLPTTTTSSTQKVVKMKKINSIEKCSFFELHTYSFRLWAPFCVCIAENLYANRSELCRSTAVCWNRNNNDFFKVKLGVREDQWDQLDVLYKLPEAQKKMLFRDKVAVSQLFLLVIDAPQL